MAKLNEMKTRGRTFEFKNNEKRQEYRQWQKHMSTSTNALGRFRNKIKKNTKGRQEQGLHERNEYRLYREIVVDDWTGVRDENVFYVPTVNWEPNTLYA